MRRKSVLPGDAQVVNLLQRHFSLDDVLQVDPQKLSDKEETETTASSGSSIPHVPMGAHVHPSHKSSGPPLVTPNIHGHAVPDRFLN